MKIQIARSKYVIEAARERVWGLLPFSIFNGVEGIEKISVLSEKVFRAEMPIRLSFIRLKAHLSGKIMDIHEPETLAVALEAKVIGGLIQVKQNIVFTLNSSHVDETEVSCEVVANGIGPIFRWILLKRAQATGQTTLDNIEKYLKRLA